MKIDPASDRLAAKAAHVTSVKSAVQYSDCSRRATMAVTIVSTIGAPASAAICTAVGQLPMNRTKNSTTAAQSASPPSAEAIRIPSEIC